MSFKYRNMKRIEKFGDIGLEYLLTLGIPRRNALALIEGPSPQDELDPMVFKNMEKMIDRLHYNFTKNKRFFLQVDSDMDGYTSSAIFYAYFKKLFPQSDISWDIHPNKEHGIDFNLVPVATDVLIIPDAGTNDVEQQERAVREDREVLIIDHHHVDKILEHDLVTIVNNQFDNQTTNRQLSGAGMVYKTIQAYDKKYNSNKGDYKLYADIAAMGNIADMMSITALDTNHMLRSGLSNIRNPFLKSLIELREYSISNTEEPNNIDVSFYIAPIINGVIRSGTIEEKKQMFEALSDYSRTEETINSISRGQERTESYYDYVARVSSNAKARQDRIKKKHLESIIQKVEEQGLHKNKLLIYISGGEGSEDFIPPTLRGLIANELLKIYGNPTLVLQPIKKKGEMHYSGSLRAKPMPGFNSFKDFLTESGLAGSQGHAMAAGAWFKQKDLKALHEYANEKLKDIDFTVDEIEVDEEYVDRIDATPLSVFAGLSKVYGRNVPEPTFAFKFKMPKSDIKPLGSKGNHLKINFQGISFIKFFAEEELENLKASSEVVEVTIVGRSSFNEWRGNKTVQVIVEHIKFKDIARESIFLF